MNSVSELESILQRLEEFGVRLGLDTTRRLLAALGNPEADLRAVLVAGTNGKGSTSALLAGMSTSAGYRTGLYTSPHLECVEERLRIDGNAIGSQDLALTVEEVVTTAEERLGYLPTYFEALTAAAFLWFARQSVDLAVLEVGMGGRLDATNACNPLVSLITEIGLDHQRYLGNTVASIAREKAGILRADRPAFAWVEKASARDAIGSVADEVGARIGWAPALISIEARQDLGWSGQQVGLRTATRGYNVTLTLPGRHQVANLSLAVLAAEELATRGMDGFDGETIAAGASSIRWPGRMEWVELPSGPVLLDVAHNPDGAVTLQEALDSLEGTYVLLFGALADKDVHGLLPRLAARAEKVVLTTADSPRTMEPGRLAQTIPDSDVIVEADRGDALTAALEAKADFVVVCGSVYLVGAVRVELRRRFGIPAAATADLLSR